MHKCIVKHFNHVHFPQLAYTNDFLIGFYKWLISIKVFHKFILLHIIFLKKMFCSNLDIELYDLPTITSLEN
jgi:hypothetical protein